MCKHHALIRSLLIEVRRLRVVNANIEETYQDAYYYQTEATSRLQRTLDLERKQAAEDQRQREYDQWDREAREKKLADRLERARAWGDSYEEERVIRELKRGW